MVQASTAGSVVACCQAVGLASSGYYYQPRGESALNLQLIRLLEEYTRLSFKGAVGMRDHLRLMGLQTVYPKPRLSVPGAGGTRYYPYLLGERVVKAPNEVWSIDITYTRWPAASYIW